MSIKTYTQTYRRDNTNLAEKHNFEMTELKFSGVFNGGIMEIGIKTYKEYPSGSSRSTYDTTHLTRSETEALRDHLSELLDDRERW